jgi:hypothetical protein
MAVLKNDPRMMSHVWGQEVCGIKRSDAQQAQDRVDQIVQDLCHHYAQDPETICRILRTMIAVYGIDLDTKAQSFPLLHNTIIDYVSQHHTRIEVYQ